MIKKIKPNLFDFATSELSQDALICWLLAWASNGYNETDVELRLDAKKLILQFFHKFDNYKEIILEEIEFIEKLEKQHMKTDIFFQVHTKRHGTHFILTRYFHWQRFSAQVSIYFPSSSSILVSNSFDSLEDPPVKPSFIQHSPRPIPSKI